MCWSAGDRMLRPGGDVEFLLHRVFQQWVGTCRLRPGRPRRFLPRLQPSVGGASAHEAGGGGGRNANGQTTVYASWNGSTETVAWELLAGPTRTSLSPVSITPRTGFETAIATTAAGPFYEVKALDAGGKVLKTSAVIRAQS